MAIQARLDLGGDLTSDSAYYRVEAVHWVRGGQATYTVAGYASKALSTVAPPVWRKSLSTDAASLLDSAKPLIAQIYDDLRMKIAAATAARAKSDLNGVGSLSVAEKNVLAGSNPGIIGLAVAV